MAIRGSTTAGPLTNQSPSEKTLENYFKAQNFDYNLREDLAEMDAQSPVMQGVLQRVLERRRKRREG